MSSRFTIITGKANPTLAATIACELGTQLGACVVDRYPNGDVAVQLLDFMRRKEVFLVQPTSPPVNDHLVELLARRCLPPRRCRAYDRGRTFFGYGGALGGLN